MICDNTDLWLSVVIVALVFAVPAGWMVAKLFMWGEE